MLMGKYSGRKIVDSTTIVGLARISHQVRCKHCLEVKDNGREEGSGMGG